MRTKRARNIFGQRQNFIFNLYEFSETIRFINGGSGKRDGLSDILTKLLLPELALGF